MTIEPTVPLVEEILAPHSSEIGAQFEAYKNHVYRVLHFCFAFHSPDTTGRDQLIIAACFHDLGMWPGDEIDYVAPSIAKAKEYLQSHGKAGWVDDISVMIDLHHRFRSAPEGVSPLVEVFRKGDWVDATMGLRSFGLPRATIRQVQEAFPNLGFHNNLVRIACRNFWSRPLNPLPMMRW